MLFSSIKRFASGDGNGIMNDYCGIGQNRSSYKILNIIYN